MLSRTMQLIAHTCSNGIGGCCLGDAIANLEVMDGIEYLCRHDTNRMTMLITQVLYCPKSDRQVVRKS